MIEIFTDGSCDQKRRLGGWSYLITEDNRVLEQDSFYDKDTTSNRMELTGILKSLEMINSLEIEENITVYSDSLYAINTLLGKFKAKSNLDLWSKINWELRVFPKRVIWYWVKGHNGNKFNEEADKLASISMNKLRKLIDFQK